MTNSASKIALVTGGSRGIGRNVVEHLAARGVRVVLTYRQTEGEAMKVVDAISAAGGEAAALQLEQGDVRRFDAFAQAFGDVIQGRWARSSFDFLVNNAGGGLGRPIAQTEEAEFDTLVNVHLKGVFFLTQKLLPLLADGGRIVNISTGLTRFSLPGSAAYAMMKGGVEVFTRYLSKELGSRGVIANTIAPGPIETDFNGGGVRDNPEVNARVAGMTALGRAGVVDDVGPLIATLLSEEGRWVNGQRIEVSGGINL